MTESTETNPEANIHSHASLAEEVRAYLVTVRGGAPFLSASDGRLLVQWLDEGVPVAVVLSAIERTAHRRAGRRRRTRLSLGACKGEVKKLFGQRSPLPRDPTRGAPGTPMPSAPKAAPIVQREAQRIADLSVPPAAEPARSALVTALRTLAATAESPAHIEERIPVLFRTFHEQLWNTTASLHGALREDATQSLSPLSTVVSQKVFADLVDEHVRQAVRNLVPGVEVGPLWSQLQPGVSP